MNLRVLPASCRQINQCKALPAGCRQHLRGSWSQCTANRPRGLSMNRRWYGVPPLGGCASPDQLKPELHAIGGSWSQRVRESERGLSMNLAVRRTPAAADDFLLLLLLLLVIEERRVRLRLRVRVRQDPGSWSQPCRKNNPSGRCVLRFLTLI